MSSWIERYSSNSELSFAVVGVDYPNLGLSEAWNDPELGMLRLATYAATPSRRGQPTNFRVTKLGEPRTVRVRCDGTEYPRWRIVADDAIELECEIGTHRFEVETRERRAGEPDAATAARGPGTSSAGAAQSKTYAPEPTSACGGCCSPTKDA